MFDSYKSAKKRKAPPWAAPVIITAAVIHGMLVVAMWIKSFWDIEKLELQKGAIEISAMLAPPPPPPPPPGGKKPEEVKKDVVKKKKVTETVQPVPKKVVEEEVIEDIGDPDGVEGGEIGGVEGGVAGGVPEAPPPPPPPPPPAKPQNVPPTALESQRIAGEKLIIPDDVTKTEIQRSGKTKLVASYKLCLTVGGTIASVQQLKGSGFPAYDAKLQREIKGTWKYRPFMINGKPAPVCTAVTFIYNQKQ